MDKIDAIEIQDTAFKRIPATEIQDTAIKKIEATKIENTAIKKIPATPLLNNAIDTKQYYIFSKAFYENDFDNMDDFEKEIMNFINKRPVDIEKLMWFYHNVGNWTTEEQFYKIPILTVILESFIKTMRKEL